MKKGSRGKMKERTERFKKPGTCSFEREQKKASLTRGFDLMAGLIRSSAAVSRHRCNREKEVHGLSR